MPQLLGMRCAHFQSNGRRKLIVDAVDTVQMRDVVVSTTKEEALGMFVAPLLETRACALRREIEDINRRGGLSRTAA
ncbi:MAG TPA: hypothetical protein VG713_17050 [Pirellulales bacterium]|nr:hypothetical protein [Pirellulales bacterium]